MENKILVFVYGTLLSGEGNNLRFLQNPESKLIGKCAVAGFIMHNLGAYPACVQTVERNRKIFGEIWEVSADKLHDLDLLEGHPHFYERILIDTNYGDAWIYINNKAVGYPEIESGNWKEHIKGE